MRVLIVHNHYQSAGGEDAVVRAEISLLRAKGNDVELLQVDNDNIVGKLEAAKAALQCAYSLTGARLMHDRIRQFRPDLVHVHNFFPRLSPSVHYVCRQARVPIVQTLHNYRLLCPAFTLSRGATPCDDCLGKIVPWPAIQHSCYRHSKTGSAVVATMLSIHRMLKTWDHTVARFVALTAFARGKFIEGGLPAGKIMVKPNFLGVDPGPGAGDGGYALYVGRLSPEKGIDTLLASWQQLPTKRALKIMGDGPLGSVVRSAASTINGIEWLGPAGREEVSRAMAHATVLILPSVYYEGFPMVIVEALAAGLPIIASRLGSMAELVEQGVTGLLFPPGSPNHLARAADWAFTHPDRLIDLRQCARREFVKKYTAETNYVFISEIYESALRSVRVNQESSASFGASNAAHQEY
jgi:glycosyltransferase involved in cell wall biosynthesis